MKDVIDEMMRHPMQELERIMPTSQHSKLLVAAQPLMEYLKKYHNPHCIVQVTQTNAEVMEGLLAINTPSQ